MHNRSQTVAKGQHGIACMPIVWQKRFFRISGELLHHAECAFRIAKTFQFASILVTYV